MKDESTIVKYDGLSREQVLCALYNFSHPQGAGFLHFDPKPLNVDEAKNILERCSYVDYLKGRVIKVNLEKDSQEFDARLYDRDCGQGSAKKAIERYKKLGFHLRFEIKSSRNMPEPSIEFVSTTIKDEKDA